MKRNAFTTLMTLSLSTSVYASEADRSPELNMVNDGRKAISELPPSLNPSFDTLASQFLVSLTVDLTNVQGTHKGSLYRYVMQQGQMTKEQYHYHLALNREITHTNPSMEVFASTLGKDGLSIASRHVTNSLKVLEKIQAGFSMDINFVKMAAPKEEPKKPTLVRYGLAAKSIEVHNADSYVTGASTPEMNPRHAETSSDGYDWAVEEIYDESTVTNLESDGRVAQRVSARKTFVEEDGYSSLVPSPNFNIKLAPVHQGSSGSLSTQITQVDGLYHLALNRELTNGKTTRRHVFTVPLMVTTKAQKTFDDKGAERSSLIDIKHHAVANYVINLHYWHVNENYSCDLGYKIRAHQILFESKIDDIFKPSGYAGKEGNQYKLSYNFSF